MRLLDSWKPDKVNDAISFQVLFWADIGMLQQYLGQATIPKWWLQPWLVFAFAAIFADLCYFTKTNLVTSVSWRGGLTQVVVAAMAGAFLSHHAMIICFWYRCERMYVGQLVLKDLVQQIIVYGCDCSTSHVYQDGAKDVVLSVVVGISGESALFYYIFGLNLCAYPCMYSGSTRWKMCAIGGSGNPTINSQGDWYTAPANFDAKEVPNIFI
ncbi:pectin lyase fold/virulence factor, AmbAllergen [Artemisia annua]|uniref:Pectin lyase fold/virulence factor, AmbAllergen n=1 Tax=Artemisia annua TaxID=35608 RepID=A0A2U1Q5S2_ARTAN|nr:pectin lyase fold/virulence factor, AmbAllergen [Artemisia annua]